MILLYQKTILILIYAAVVAVFTGCAKTEKLSGVKKSEVEAKALQKAVIALKNRYELGNIEETSSAQLNCADLISPSLNQLPYLRCNRLYLECYLRNNNLEVKVADKKYQVEFLKKDNNFTSILAKSIHLGSKVPSYGVQLFIKIPKLSPKIYPIIFQNTCEMTYLPQRVYKMHALKKTKVRLFDNFTKDYFIDKYLVKNKDINEWLELDPKLKIKKIKEISKLHLPAISLTREQQESYCFFRGKRLLESHIYDAATVLPSSADPKKAPLRMSKLPWKEIESGINDFIAGKTLNYASKENCSKIYTRECQTEFYYQSYADSNSSWMGIFEVMGGYLESVNNILEPDQNIVPTSKYFSARAKDIHRLGVRASWKGSSHSISTFNFIINGTDYSKEVNEHELGVGFRCMKEVGHEAI